MERIVELEVTVAAVNVGIVVALHKVGDRVDIGVVHEAETGAATLGVCLRVLVVTVPKIFTPGVAAEGNVGVDGLCGVIGDCLVDSTFVTEAVADVVTLHVGVNLEVSVEELGIEVEACNHAVHLRGLDDTVGVGI